MTDKSPKEKPDHKCYVSQNYMPGECLRCRTAARWLRYITVPSVFTRGAARTHAASLRGRRGRR